MMSMCSALYMMGICTDSLFWSQVWMPGNREPPPTTSTQLNILRFISSHSPQRSTHCTMAWSMPSSWSHWRSPSQSRGAAVEAAASGGTATSSSSRTPCPSWLSSS
ncbi:unnamed protein product [Ixodes pacificus]